MKQNKYRNQNKQINNNATENHNKEEQTTEAEEISSSSEIQISTQDEYYKAPTKTKQMGNIDSNLKIYIEDYVYTYLYQYGKAQLSSEKVALLVGNQYKLNGQTAIVISGAIIGKYSENVGGVEFFTEKTWEYIGAEMDKYFPNTITLGWVHLLAGSGGFYTDTHLKLHREFFQESYQQLFVIDPTEKLDYFYSCNKQHLIQRDGYFIYYDKNQEMQEYMLDNSMVKEKTNTNSEEIDICNPTMLEDSVYIAKKPVSNPLNTAKNPPQLDDIQKPHNPLEDLKETSENLNSRLRKERDDAAQDIRKVMERRAKEVEKTEKKRHHFLVAVSGSLCFLTMCIGITLSNSVERINNLEGNFLSFQTSYEKLEEDLETKVQSVFSIQTETLTPETTVALDTTSDYTDNNISTATADDISDNTANNTSITASENLSNTTADNISVAIDESTSNSTDTYTEPSTISTINIETEFSQSTPEYIESDDNSIIDTPVISYKFTHKVQEGDTLANISHLYYDTKYKVTTIMEANNITDADMILIGQELKIP